MDVQGIMIGNGWIDPASQVRYGLPVLLETSALARVPPRVARRFLFPLVLPCSDSRVPWKAPAT